MICRYNYYTPYGNFLILLMLILVGKTTFIIFSFSSFKLNFTVSSLKKGCCKRALHPLNFAQTQPSRPAIFNK